MNDTTALVIVPLNDTLELGKVLAQSGFFEDSRQASQAVVKILAGREIGIGPIAAMTGIHIIKGKPALGAGIIASAIKRSGRYNYRIRKHDGTICEIEFQERMGDKWESIGVSTFTLEDAKRAGTQNLDRFARNMLFARCISNGARWYTPDIFGGPVYTPEEMGANVNGEGDVIESTARVIQPESPAPGNGHGNPPADGWDELQGGGTQAQKPPAKPAPTTVAPKFRLPVIKCPDFPRFAKAFADDFTDYRAANGEPDAGHILGSIAKNVLIGGQPVDAITRDNITAIFDALGDHALAKQAEAQLAAEAQQ